MGNPEDRQPNQDLPDQWDGIYENAGDVFPDVQPDMPEVVELMEKKGVKNVLDLGCGGGRHSVYLAERGMCVSGIDAAPKGIQMTQDKMAENGLIGDFKVGDIYKGLPYADASFEGIVSTQTINHGKIEEIRELIKEMERVLTQKGIVFVTTAIRGEKGGKGGLGTNSDEEIAPYTYKPTGGNEKGLIHYYFDEERLKEEFSDFDTKIWRQENGRHLCLLGERKEQTEKK